jgi:glycyl-tRNA synthetase beta chain
MQKPLLIEIGVEELPAIPFLKELPNIQDKWRKILEEHALQADFEFLYTPRRLILWHREFPTKQADKQVEFFGAPLEIAYKDGVPTGAALGFAKKCGVDIKEIQTANKNAKEVLYYQKEEVGEESISIIPGMIEQFLASLHFGKSMRWGLQKEAFIRPIRWIGCMLDKEVVQMQLYGVQSDNKSFGHRTLTYLPFSYENSGDFFCQLSKAGVILKESERKEIILSQFKAIEKASACTIEVDQELLAEVVAITENPHALIGTFDEKFLTLPPEVIITSMKEHQRYFAVFKDGKLSNQFIVVSNAITKDYSAIVKGNEKVLHARLSDGLFFYENDLKVGLQTEGLKNITFMQGAGSVYDKSLRELDIATYLADTMHLQDKTLLEKAVRLSKADLLTDMVYEFTELQGLMGYYYTKAAGDEEALALALKEQYLPDGEDSDLPSSDLSAIVAMSHKLDSLFTLFALGKIPTGTKDPFALRRAAIGILKIVNDRGFSFDIRKDVENISRKYEGLDSEKIEQFFIERLNQYFDVNSSIIQAVLQSGERDIVRMSQKIEALAKIVEEKDFKAYSSTFKRVANIIKDMDETAVVEVDTALLCEVAEKRLQMRFQEIQTTQIVSYHDRLEKLFSLKPEIDTFFDSVMVNVEDEKVKQNRKNLILQIYLGFKEIADIKEITI